MKQNTRLPNSQAKEPWTCWGRPTEVLIDRALSFQSAPLQQVLTELENGGARERDPQP
jgi:hypothetical protein